MNIFVNKNFILDVDLVFKWLIIIIPITIILGNFILNLNILLVDILFLYFFLKKKILLNKNFSILLLCLSIIFFTNIVFSSDLFLSIRGGLGVLKFIIFFLAFVFFLNKESNKNFFFKFIFYVILFVTIDVFIQYLFGKDLFGIETNFDHGKRLSGPFGDELVVGAYLSKLFFLGLIYINYLKKNFYYFISYLLILIVTIFVTQERSAFFMSLISLLFFIIFFKINLKYKMLFFTSIIVVLVLFIKFDNYSSYKYIVQTISQFGLSKTAHNRGYSDVTFPIYPEGDLVKHKINNFWDSRYGAHFLTAYEIFLDNKIIGGGAKTFRKKCSLSKYENIKSHYVDQRCNTHPHNLYFELLAETGLLIFVPFCILILFLVLKNIKSLIIKNNYTNSLINLCLLIILFFPIQTTGSFFSTFNGVFYWIGFAIVTHNMRLNIFRNSTQ